MNYLVQVQRGIDFIEDHLEEDIDVKEVTQIAGVSHWHFQRMFKALTKETLKGYIRSRRLANSRLALLSSDNSILELALRAGFSSQASYTRAFQKAFAMAPGQYRDLGNSHLLLAKVKIDQEYLLHLGNNVSLTPSIVSEGVRHMVGVRTTCFGIDSERNNIGETLPSLWQDFLPRLAEIPESVPGTCYGVVRPAEKDGELLEYSAVMEVASEPERAALPENMVYVAIPAARYAVFTHKGNPVNIDHTVNYIYSSWFGQTQEKHSYRADIEIYGPDYLADSEDSVMRYAVPLVL